MAKKQSTSIEPTQHHINSIALDQAVELEFIQLNSTVGVKKSRTTKKPRAMVESVKSAPR